MRERENGTQNTMYNGRSERRIEKKKESKRDVDDDGKEKEVGGERMGMRLRVREKRKMHHAASKGKKVA